MNSDRPPETVRAYLVELRRALKGAAPGLISDALADCEEHLNNEIAQNPELDEPTILASVVETLRFAARNRRGVPRHGSPRSPPHFRSPNSRKGAVTASLM